MSNIFPLSYSQIPACVAFVEAEWGEAAGSRALQQMIEYFKGGKYAPVFYVYEHQFNGASCPRVAGFCAFRPLMIMNGAYEFCWSIVAPEARGVGIGVALTQYRIREIAKLDGSLITLMTEHPKFFEKFGFEIGFTTQSWSLMAKQLKSLEM